MAADDDKNKHWLEKIPEESRKMMLVVIIVVLVIIILVFWLNSLKYALNPQPQDAQRTEELKKIQDDFSALFQRTQDEFSNIEKDIQELTAPNQNQEQNDTLDLSPEEVNELKEKLEAQNIKNQQSYINDVNGYQIQFATNTVEIVLDQISRYGTKGDPIIKIKTGGQLSLGVWDNPQNLSAQDWLNDFYSQPNGWPDTFDETSINQQVAYNATKLGDCYFNWVIIPQDAKFYTLTTEICGSSPAESIQIAQDIIKTFRFIN